MPQRRGSTTKRFWFSLSVEARRRGHGFHDGESDLVDPGDNRDAEDLRQPRLLHELRRAVVRRRVHDGHGGVRLRRVGPRAVHLLLGEPPLGPVAAARRQARGSVLRHQRQLRPQPPELVLRRRRLPRRRARRGARGLRVDAGLRRRRLRLPEPGLPDLQGRLGFRGVLPPRVARGPEQLRLGLDRPAEPGVRHLRPIQGRQHVHGQHQRQGRVRGRHRRPHVLRAEPADQRRLQQPHLGHPARRGGRREARLRVRPHAQLHVRLPDGVPRVRGLGLREPRRLRLRRRGERLHGDRRRRRRAVPLQGALRGRGLRGRGDRGRRRRAAAAERALLGRSGEPRLPGSASSRSRASASSRPSSRASATCSRRGGRARST